MKLNLKIKLASLCEAQWWQIKLGHCWWNSYLTLFCMFIVFFLSDPSPMVWFLFWICGLLCCLVHIFLGVFLVCFFFLTNLLPFRILHRILQDWRGDRMQWKWVLAELSWWWSTAFSAVAHFSPQPLLALILLSWQLSSNFSELISLSSTWITSLWLLLAIEYSVLVDWEQPVRTVPFGNISLLIWLILITLPCWQ